MSTREETRQLRLASWQQIFADRAAYGLIVKQTISREIGTSTGCRLPEKNALAAMPENTFGFALLEEPKQKPATTGFSQDQLPGITIEFGNIRISLADGIRKEQFAAVLEVITHVE